MHLLSCAEEHDIHVMLLNCMTIAYDTYIHLLRWRNKAVLETVIIHLFSMSLGIEIEYNKLNIIYIVFVICVFASSALHIPASFLTR